ncbi:hypothetical protein BY996DRAFT_6418563 [Phakopsora pachyrhizi]|nr:hypothetical protein BY996DRAFT_6418563 [Phakopsora pachyrhizi]
MPFDYPSTSKICRRFSTRLNSSSGSLSGGSPFGDQLSRQLEAQLKMQGLSLESTIQTGTLHLGRSHSVSSAPPSPLNADPLTKTCQDGLRRSDSLGRGGFQLYSCLHSMPNRQFCSTCCSPALLQTNLNRNSSISSSESYLSTRSSISLTSSPFQNFHSRTSSVGEVDSEEVKELSQEEFEKLNSTPIKTATVHKTIKKHSTRSSNSKSTDIDYSNAVLPTTVSSIANSSSLKGPMRILRSLSLNLHSSRRSKKTNNSSAPTSPTRAKSLKLGRSTHRQKTSKKLSEDLTRKSLSSRESLYEPVDRLMPNPPTKKEVLVEKPTPKPKTLRSGFNSPQNSAGNDYRKVKFNPTTQTIESHSDAQNGFWDAEMYSAKMNFLRSPPQKALLIGYEKRRTGVYNRH